jgi:hypothetical protein
MVNVFLAFTFGLAFLFIPQQFIAFYGLHANPDGLVFTRSLGGALVGLGFIVFLVSKSKDRNALRGLVVGGLVLHIANGITDYLAVTEGTIDQVGYSIVLLHAVLALGFLYYFIRNPKIIAKGT